MTVSQLKVINSENGRVSAEFQVEKQHLVCYFYKFEIQQFVFNKFEQNRLESVHGGLLATVVDIGGSLAIASKGLFATGVSTDINISYISGVKQGETISIDARVDKLGKTLAFTTVEMTSKGRLGND